MCYVVKMSATITIEPFHISCSFQAKKGLLLFTQYESANIFVAYSQIVRRDAGGCELSKVCGVVLCQVEWTNCQLKRSEYHEEK